MRGFQPGQSGNPRGLPGRPPNNHVDRLFSEQLRIVGNELVDVPFDEPEQKPNGKKPNRNSKAYKKKQNELRKKNSQKVTKLRVIAQMAYRLAMKGNLEAMNFIADRMEGKPAVQQFIAVARAAHIEADLTVTEAKDRLMSMGIDVERLPLLADLRPEREQ
jgi:hypothetical protein